MPQLMNRLFRDPAAKKHTVRMHKPRDRYDRRPSCNLCLSEDEVERFRVEVDRSDPEDSVAGLAFAHLQESVRAVLPPAGFVGVFRKTQQDVDADFGRETTKILG